MTVRNCIWFDGRAEEAADLYVSLLPDSRVEGVARAPEGTPGIAAGDVLTVLFTLAGQRYMILNGGPQFPQSESFSISVDCDSQAEIDRLWDALIAGGGEESHCGWLKDRFGVSWQIVPSQIGAWMSEPAAAARVMAAFLPMTKLDMATLEAACRGE